MLHFSRGFAALFKESIEVDILMITIKPNERPLCGFLARNLKTDGALLQTHI